MYFAYGSNLDWKQMESRCPSARFICKAVLKNHQLEFTRFSKSKDRQCGVADVIPKEGQDVWGVVYEIDKTDIGNLDSTEGFQPDRPSAQNSYLREECLVFEENDPARPLTASIYIAVKQKGQFYPSQEYKDLIVNGARFRRFPADYIGALEKIEIQ